MVNGIKHAINHQHMAGLWLLLIDIKGKWVADDLNGSENCHFDIAGKAMSSLAPQDFSFLGGSSRTPLGKQWWDNVGDFMGNFCRRFYGRQWDILLNDKSMAMLNSWRLPVFYTGFSMWRPWEKPASDRTRSENMPERPHNDELGTDPSGPQWSGLRHSFEMFPLFGGIDKWNQVAELMLLFAIRSTSRKAPPVEEHLDKFEAGVGHGIEKGVCSG